MSEDPSTQTTPKKGDALKGCITILVLLAVIYFAFSYACKRSKEGRIAHPTPQASPMDKALRKVQDIGDVEGAAIATLNGRTTLNITISQKAVWSGNNFVLTTAGTIQRCFKELASMGQLASVESAVVTLKAPLADQYGHESQTPILRYAFKGEELAKINWDGMDQQRLLEFAHPEWLHLEGAKAAKAYALEGRHAEEAPTFCRIAITGK